MTNKWWVKKIGGKWWIGRGPWALGNYYSTHARALEDACWHVARS